MVNQRLWPRNAVGETVDTINVTGKNRCPVAWPSSVGNLETGFPGKGACCSGADGGILGLRITFTRGT